MTRLSSLKKSDFHHKYIPSGKYSPKSMLLALSKSSILAPLLTFFIYASFAIIIYLLILFFSWAISGISNKEQLVKDFAIFASFYGLAPIGAALALVAIVPMFVGNWIGKMVVNSLKINKIRSIKHGYILAVTSSVIGYLVCFLVTTFLFTEMASNIKVFSWIFVINKWWQYPIIMVQLIICIKVSTDAAKKFLEELPFCENCLKWYERKQNGLFDLSIEKPILSTLVSGKVDQSLGKVRNHGGISAAVEVYSCPLSDECDKRFLIRTGQMYGTGDIVYADSAEKAKTWIDTMVKADLSNKIINLLFNKKDNTKTS